MKEVEVVGLGIPGTGAGVERVRMEGRREGWLLFWAGTMQAEAGCDGAQHDLQEREERAAEMRRQSS